MARHSKRPKLMLNESERDRLKQLARSRTAAKREVERADILLRYDSGKTITDIHKETGMSRPTIYKCIDKALAAGVEAGLKDTFHRLKEPNITPEAAGWVISLACTKPKDLGLAAELWTIFSIGTIRPGTGRIRGASQSCTSWKIHRLAHPQRA
jgi:hypothetical protein